MKAEDFIKELKKHRSDVERKKLLRYFKTGKGDYAEGETFMGVRPGQVFQIAKENTDMPLSEVEKLLQSDLHEVRVGALAVMDFQARKKRTPESRRKELFEMYLQHHDRIDNWDLVDRAAPHVIGGYLFDKPRDVLYKLAESENMWERRTAVVSTYYFIKHGDLDDTFKIAEKLLNDKEDLVQKAAGSWLRQAGQKDRKRLLQFLDKNAAKMPRTMLTVAMEKLDKETKVHYRNL